MKPITKPEKKEEEIKKKKTAGSLKTRELTSLLRKLKPHVAKSINTAVEILECNESTEAGKLKASAMIVMEYQKIVKDLDASLKEDQADNPVEDVEAAPILSLRVIDTGNKEPS